MTFPEPNVLKGTIADLRDIVSRSQGDNKESVQLLGQIESIISDIESKSIDPKSKKSEQFFAAPVSVTPVSI